MTADTTTAVQAGTAEMEQHLRKEHENPRNPKAHSHFTSQIRNSEIQRTPFTALHGSVPANFSLFLLLCSSCHQSSLNLHKCPQKKATDFCRQLFYHISVFRKHTRPYGCPPLLWAAGSGHPHIDISIESPGSSVHPLRRLSFPHP